MSLTEIIPDETELEVAENKWHRFKRYIGEELEYQHKELFIWYPVFVAFGIGSYFSLPTEPPLVLGMMFLIFCLTGLGTLKHHKGFTVALLLTLISLGFLSAQIRTHLIHTPILEKKLGPTMVIGTIEAIEDMGDEEGGRVTLGDLEIEDLEPVKTPTKVRLRLRKDNQAQVGQRIQTLAQLHVPSAPVIPGGFDFQRYLYFQQIGAVGFIYKDFEILEDQQLRSFSRTVERWRHDIAQTVEENLNYPQASIAMALMVGRKTAITEEDKEAMRAAGLAHMLAISGLHVGLFSGVLFFFSRILLAAIPGMALHRPIKKYAAVIAMIGACFYMFLAGATIPTQRALLMTSIVFLAIILDRSPISLRLVSFAALIVLLLFPESLLSASFHMSFAAVVSLIVFYNWLRPVWSSWHAQAGKMKRAGLYLAGVCFTTIVASLATAPFALFHFQQVALYSLLGNVVAMPIMSFAIMPSVVASVLLLPLGLESLGFWLMDIGIVGVLDIAHWVAGLPYALLKVQTWPYTALILLVLGCLLFCLLRGGLKAAAAPLILASVLLIFIHKQPDILISSGFKLVGFYTVEDNLYVSSLRSDRFVRESWMEDYGLSEDQIIKWPKEGGEDYIRCDERACRIGLKDHEISYIKDLSVQTHECPEVDIVLSPEPLRDCNAPIQIDLFDSLRAGAHALWLDTNPPRIEVSEDLRGIRPWSALNADFHPYF